MQPSGRHPDVEVDGVLGHRLEQVEDVQVEGAGDLLVAVAAQVDVAAPPELVPGQGVPLQQLVEPLGQPADPSTRRVAVLGNGPVLGGEQGHELLHRDRLAGAHVDGEVLGDEPRLPHRPPLHVSGWPSRVTRVRAACAMPTRVALVSTRSQTRSWPAEPVSTGTRWRPSSCR
jgi:hypothetical protein